MSRRRCAVVTGGGTGIGLASAHALAGAGLDVLIAGRRAEVLERAAAEIRAAAPGARVAAAVADVGRPADCEALVAAAVEQLGRVDVLVNAAAIYEPVPFLELTAERWDATLDVDLRGTALTSVAAARWMAANGGGRIVLVSSVNAEASVPAASHYSAAKAALHSLARSMAQELAPSGIAVNAVAPGWVRTPMTEAYLATSTPERLARLNPLARAGEADEIASLIRYLACEAPPFLTGAALIVDGGQTAISAMP
ncbi:MAG: SDR family oxidoreductase [Thermoleophilia bacterium]